MGVFPILFQSLFLFICSYAVFKDLLGACGSKVWGDSWDDELIKYDIPLGLLLWGGSAQQWERAKRGKERGRQCGIVFIFSSWQLRVEEVDVLYYSYFTYYVLYYLPRYASTLYLKL